MNINENAQRTKGAPASVSPLLSRKEAAAYLGVECGTLEVWACTDRYELPYVKIGRLAKYRLSDLDDFIASRTVGAVSAKQRP